MKRLTYCLLTFIASMPLVVLMLLSEAGRVASRLGVVIIEYVERVEEWAK